MLPFNVPEVARTPWPRRTLLHGLRVFIITWAQGVHRRERSSLVLLTLAAVAVFIADFNLAAGPGSDAIARRSAWSYESSPRLVAPGAYSAHLVRSFLEKLPGVGQWLHLVPEADRSV
jgi:hypothetical protein